jgi:hypothetical protein
MCVLSKKRLKMSTSRDVRKAVNRIANMLLNKEIDPKTANAILYAANVTLGAIRVDEIEHRIDDLENTLSGGVQ